MATLKGREHLSDKLAILFSGGALSPSRRILIATTASCGDERRLLVSQKRRRWVAWFVPGRAIPTEPVDEINVFTRL